MPINRDEKALFEEKYFSQEEKGETVVVGKN